MPNEATPVDVSSKNAEEINLVLIEKKIVRGVVSIPEGLPEKAGCP